MNIKNKTNCSHGLLKILFSDYNDISTPISIEKDKTHKWENRHYYFRKIMVCSICELEKVQCENAECEQWLSEDLSCDEYKIKKIIE